MKRRRREKTLLARQKKLKVLSFLPRPPPLFLPSLSSFLQVSPSFPSLSCFLLLLSLAFLGRREGDALFLLPLIFLPPSFPLILILSFLLNPLLSSPYSSPSLPFLLSLDIKEEGEEEGPEEEMEERKWGRERKHAGLLSSSSSPFPLEEEWGENENGG